MSLSPMAAAYASISHQAGPLEGPAQYGASGTPGDGPYVEIWVQVDEGTVKRASYRTPGCPSSSAAAGMLCAVAEGRPVEVVLALSSLDLLALLGGLPEGKGHFADLAIQAMGRALRPKEA